MRLARTGRATSVAFQDPPLQMTSSKRRAQGWHTRLFSLAVTFVVTAAEIYRRERADAAVNMILSSRL